MIKIEELAAPTGEARVQTGNQVEIRYKGTFPEGKQFDAGTFGFRVGSGQVIDGFDLGVQGMGVGQKRRITVPPELAYGSRGAGRDIPPNATLVFEIEVLKIS